MFHLESEKKSHSPYSKVLWLNVPPFYCSTSNISECEENTEDNETEAVQGGEQATQEGEGKSQSVDETARPSARPSPSQRSIHVSILLITNLYQMYTKASLYFSISILFSISQVSHDRPTTSQSLRHVKKPENPEMDKAMKSFMDEMTSFKRQESKDPFCNPNNSNLSYTSKSSSREADGDTYGYI